MVYTQKWETCFLLDSELRQLGRSFTKEERGKFPASDESSSFLWLDKFVIYSSNTQSQLDLRSVINQVTPMVIIM